MTDRPKELIIAVVDDDPRVVESLGNLLESADYSVRLFESAGALLASNGLGQIACLISDIDMPVMDGFELLRIIRKTWPGLPVILITGQSNKLNQPTPLDFRHLPLLKKPFSAQDLLSILNDLLQQRSPGSP